MTYNKTLPSVLSCMLALSMLAACSSGTPAVSSEAAGSESASSDGHTHTAALWDRDVNTHWQNCDCGETFNTGDHTLGEDLVCTECGSEIWMFESGAEVYNYTENGEYSRITAFDPDGAVLQDMRWEYEYDANGNCTSVTNYYDGVLAEVTEYTLEADGTVLSFKTTSYSEDGSYSVGEYTAEYENLASFQYDADGTEIFREEYDYAEENGEPYLAQKRSYHNGVLYLLQEFNRYGDDLLFREVDENGNTVSEMSHEYTYTADGIKESSRFIVDGVLVQESFYVFLDDEFGGRTEEERMRYHNEDGTVEETFYSKASGYNDPEKVILYDADGNVLAESIYENTYNENGEMLSEKIYTDGVLREEAVFEIIDTEEEYTHYLKTQTVYNEDGTKAVTEFSPEEELGTTTYDAGGNIVE